MPFRGQGLIFVALAGIAFAVERPPIVMSPGLYGSKIEWKLSKNHKGMPNDCFLVSKSKYQLAWAAVNTFALHHNCFLSSAETTCDHETFDKLGYPVCAQKFGDALSYRNPKFGTLEPIRFLDSITNLTVARINYFYHAERFLLKHGWKGEGKDIFAVPYDWRFTPNGYSKPNNNFDAPYKGTDFDRYKRTVETAVTLNKGQRAILMGHSMGGCFLHEFLQEQTTEWINKHVAAVLLIMPAVAGSPFAVGATMGAMKLGPVPGSYLEEVFYSWPVAAYLSPVIGTIDKSTTVAIYKNSHYNMETVEQLYAQINGQEAAKSYHLIRKRVSERMLKAPNAAANYTVLIGKGIATSSEYTVDNITAIHKAKAHCSGSVTGDGTLPYQPLRNLVNKWQMATGSTDRSGSVQAKEVSQVEHGQVVTSKDGVEKVLGPTIIEVVKKYTGFDASAVVVSEENLPDYGVDESQLIENWAPF